jgi:hypothetical protein
MEIRRMADGRQGPRYSGVDGRAATVSEKMNHEELAETPFEVGLHPAREVKHRFSGVKLGCLLEAVGHAQKHLIGAVVGISLHRLSVTHGVDRVSVG